MELVCEISNSIRCSLLSRRESACQDGLCSPTSSDSWTI